MSAAAHVSINMIDTCHGHYCTPHLTTLTMAEEQDDLFWWHNYLSFLEWNSQWYAEHGELHHPEDAFHVHEIVVGKVEKEDVFKDPDTIVHAETWNDPTWRGILHPPQPIMCGGVLSV